MQAARRRAALRPRPAGYYLAAEPTHPSPQSEYAVANDEPAYLKAIRQQQQRQRPGASTAPQPGTTRGDLSPAERETVRWAREVAGREVAVQPSLRGAKCAILYLRRGADPKSTPLLAGVESRDALVSRLQLASMDQETVLGCFEVSSLRPLTPETTEGKTTFAAGPARTLPKQLTPEQMIRRAAAEAERLARTRKPDEGKRDGGRGPGGGGRGR
ncbi:MAG TPA: hypothetical protein VNK43_08370 [Gemmatimonadales bacterium]|nr:hypothetical protein [Gemmatimonadales bacterium]